MDAIIAERLTSNPRIFDIYGYCGLTILSEFFYHGDIESLVMPGDGYAKNNVGLNDDEKDVNPKNKKNITPDQKLKIALEMAEAILVLHSYPNGMIVHNDVQLSQFLFSEDFSVLKLNDFNRAEFLLWDDRNQEYCHYKNGPGNGNVSFYEN